MTAVTFFQPPDKNLLRPDDQMDLSSSPAMPIEDIDLEIDDAAEAPTDPDQDLMQEDEPERPTEPSDSAHSSINENVDDDLMIDEGITIHHGEQSDVPELNMDGQQDDHTRAEDDDDILYDEEVNLAGQEAELQENVEEVQMGDGRDQHYGYQGQTNQLSGASPSDFQAELEIGVQTDADFSEPQDIRAAPRELRSDPANLDSDANADATPSLQDDTLQQGSPSSPQRYLSDHETRHRAQSEEKSAPPIEISQSQPLEVKDDLSTSIGIAAADSKVTSDSSDAETASAEPKPNPPANVSSFDRGRLGDFASRKALIHPVKIHYLDTEMCLFPPMEEEESDIYFLQDVSLTHQTLYNLLGACREVLADTIGDDELVLDVASLGLHISEESRYAAQISLSQILDVYTHLAHNENLDYIEPMTCTLSSRVSLTSQYAYLESMAKEGKTLSQIVEETTYRPGENGGNDMANLSVLGHNGEETGYVQNAFEAVEHEGEEASTTGQGHEMGHVQGTEIEATTEDFSNEDPNDLTEPEKKEIFGNEDDSFQALTSSHGKQSPTSTVKGDSKGPEVYDGGLDLCLKPDPCSCSSCAGQTASTDAQELDEDSGDQPTQGMLGHVDYKQAESCRVELATAGDANEALRQDAESGIVTTRLQEDESDVVEEDLFFQGSNPAPVDIHEVFAESQLGGEQHLELDDHHHPDQDLRDEESWDFEMPAGNENRYLRELDGVSKSISALSNDTPSGHQALKSGEAFVSAENEQDFLNLHDSGKEEIHEQKLEIVDEASKSENDGEDLGEKEIQEQEIEVAEEGLTSEHDGEDLGEKKYQEQEAEAIEEPFTSGHDDEYLGAKEIQEQETGITEEGFALEQDGEDPGQENLVAGQTEDERTKAHDEALGHPDPPMDDLEKKSLLKAQKPGWSSSTPAKAFEKSLTEIPQDAPNTPQGSQPGSKRKALEDEEDFDLFDLSTPDNKRRRSS